MVGCAFGPRLLLSALLLLLTSTSLQAADAAPSLTDDIEAFRKQVRPLVRSFIFQRYEQFSESELTFRDLKTHVSNALGVPYEALKTDEASAIIEDENDKIANRCDGGKRRCRAEGRVQQPLRPLARLSPSSPTHDNQQANASTHVASEDISPAKPHGARWMIAELTGATSAGRSRVQRPALRKRSRCDGAMGPSASLGLAQEKKVCTSDQICRSTHKEGQPERGPLGWEGLRPQRSA
eukprot:995359-Prymnesium_polylepis.1